MKVSTRNQITACDGDDKMELCVDGCVKGGIEFFGGVGV